MDIDFLSTLGSEPDEGPRCTPQPKINQEHRVSAPGILTEEDFHALFLIISPRPPTVPFYDGSILGLI